MSAHELHAGHDHHGEEEIHVSFGGYLTGFILAVILTVIPFWLVMNKVIADRSTAVLVLGLFAIVQVIVHMYFFLHMNGKIQGGWTLLSSVFTIVFVVITLAGTLWVMFHMNANMMPTHSNLPAVTGPAETMAPAEMPAMQHAEPAPADPVPAAPVAESLPAAVDLSGQPVVEAAPAAEAQPAAAAAHGAHGNN